ncbi:restriction endonuclease [Streptomyces sp. NPDC057002]|uniref:restriction endonuclease n=1 Tax=Streptomyces sp. NPDC057002 TaxID=3345992 RepID=UPI0036253A29
MYSAKESIVVTNGTFTEDAAAWGSVHGIHLIDRAMLVSWSEKADHLYQLVALDIPT